MIQKGYFYLQVYFTQYSAPDLIHRLSYLASSTHPHLDWKSAAISMIMFVLRKLHITVDKTSRFNIILNRADTFQLSLQFIFIINDHEMKPCTSTIKKNCQYWVKWDCKFGLQLWCQHNGLLCRNKPYCIIVIDNRQLLKSSL